MDEESGGNGDLIVVGVGASAGGLEAFTELLRHLPPTTGMAFVFVQHLDPHYESALPELLAAKTRMTVLQAQNECRIQPDHVYVIPPNTLMRIREGALVLETRPPTPELFRPIDAFFSSLAEEFRFHAVGVVLSGTASDGTLGLKAINDEGGITFAQNETAKFDGMPRSAIATGVVHFVLPPGRIAEELAAIAHRGPNLSRAETVLATDGTGLDRLLALMRKHTGVDFTQYKQPTILRRLNRRMLLRKSESLEQYCQLLQEEPGESKSLFDDLLIGVTAFFRDPEVFEAAQKIAFPSLIRDRKRPNTLRAWIPGCSSGEEVYSMAIALVEFLEGEDLEYAIQMFGTDISDGAIAKARAGAYGESEVANVSQERLRRFFVRTETGYQISRSIRDMCVFSRHNLGQDPPLSRMDLISCRNLLIYLSPSLQQRIVAAFGYALQPNGCLFLGSSESLGALADYFQPLHEECKIYSRKPRIPEGVLAPSESVGGHPAEPSATPAQPGNAEASKAGRMERHVDQLVLSRYGPARVVVDETLRITEFRGHVAPYLAASVIEPEARLLDVVSQDLRTPLSVAIEQARRTSATVVMETVPSLRADQPEIPAITVVPLSLAGIAQQFLILFGRPEEHESQAQTDAAAEPTAPAQPPLPPGVDAQLQRELRSTREYLQSVIEGLRSTNEEAESSIEELQSANEELQTSKEELQSANEELNTITAELQSRNHDLAQVNDDLMNLLASLSMPIIMTGNDLRIRRFTPMAERALRLIPTDVGRPISDLKPRIDVPNLEEILHRVIDSLQPFEQEVKDEEGRLYLMRVRPYRTADNRIDGTVVQLLDVSELKHSLEEVKHARDYAEAIVNTVREPLAVLDENLTIQTANRAFYDAVQATPANATGRTIYDVGRGYFDAPQVAALFARLDGDSTQLNEVEIDRTTDRGETRILSLNVRRLSTPERRRLILMAFADITERKRAAEARYRRVFESARDGIVLVDAETGGILDLNPYAEALLGYARSELVGRKLWEIEPMRNLPKLRAAIEQIRDQGVLRFEDLVLRTKDGVDVQTEVIANVYSQGERQAIQFNIRDVSERKKFERELQETQKLESLGLLAGGIAHDFNNLLTGIIGNASLAYSEASVGDPLRMQLRAVLQAGERAAFLTRQLLAYAGRGRFVTETIDLGDLVEEISTLLRTSIPKTVELKLYPAPDLPLVEADPAQIQQVVMNLVINGAEAIGENVTGTVEIRTSLRHITALETAEFFRPEQAAGGTFVQLEVTDTGSGMDQATMAHIFDPFFTTKFTGRGLGLAAVQGIVKGHGGAIRVYSTPGHGTTFLVLLPATGKKATVRRRERSRVPSIPSGSVALVIDDEESVRSLDENVLSRAGMRVLTAEDGKAGVDAFRKHHGIVSVVVLDLQMGVMGGEEAFPLLKEIDPSVPVILSSGFDEAEAARRFSGLKPARFLQKPYTAERLVQAVATALKREKA